MLQFLCFVLGVKQPVLSVLCTMINRVKLDFFLNVSKLSKSSSSFFQLQNRYRVKLKFFKTWNLASSSNNYSLTVSSLSQAWALAVFSLRHKNTYEWNKTKTNHLQIYIWWKFTYSSRNQCFLKLQKSSKVKFYSSIFKSSYTFE